MLDTPPELDAISGNCAGRAASESQPSSSSGLPSAVQPVRSKLTTILEGVGTLAAQGGYLYLVKPMIQEGWTLWIASGRWAPFVCVSAVTMCVVAPMAFGKIVDAAKATLPFLKK